MRTIAEATRPFLSHLAGIDDREARQIPAEVVHALYGEVWEEFYIRFFEALKNPEEWANICEYATSEYNRPGSMLNLLHRTCHQGWKERQEERYGYLAYGAHQTAEVHVMKAHPEISRSMMAGHTHPQGQESQNVLGYDELVDLVDILGSLGHIAADPSTLKFAGAVYYGDIPEWFAAVAKTGIHLDEQVFVRDGRR